MEMYRIFKVDLATPNILKCQVLTKLYKFQDCKNYKFGKCV